MKKKLTLLLILVCAVTISSAQTADTELGGRAIDGKVIDTSDLSLSAIPGAVFELHISPVKITPDDNVLRILRNRGIYPDAETYTLIYDINPGLDHLTSLKTETNIILPIATGNEAFSTALKGGHLVMITVDDALKQRLGTTVLALKRVSGEFEGQKKSRFPSSAEKRDSIALVKELSGWFEHIHKTIRQRTAKPIRRPTLSQIVDEAEALAALLEELVRSNQKIRAADLSKIKALHEDLEGLIKIWDQVMSGELPAGEPQYKVVVTIKGGNDDRIRSLRVYYVVNGLFREPPTDPPVRSASFDGLGSGSSALMAIKNYKIWAAADNDPGNPVTHFKDLMVRKPGSGDTIYVDLSLK
jgi:hypothetical protein